MTDGTTLPELVGQASKIHQMIVEANGELSPELEQALSRVDLAVATKIDSYAYLERWFESQSSFYKSEADRYSKVSKALMNARERLRNGIKYAMQTLGRDEVQGMTTRYKLAGTQPSLEVNEALLPMEYKVIQYVPDSAKIRAALKEGVNIPGAALVPGVALRSYAAKKED